MPKKNSSNTAAAARELTRRFLIRQYAELQQAWNRELQQDPTDWPNLFHLHYKIARMEQLSPWLRKEVLNEIPQA